MAGLNRPFFFDGVRGPLFAGELTRGQVAGLTALLDAWEADHGNKDLRWLAYALATAHHETAQTLRPIRELGSLSYLKRMYDPAGLRPDLARRMGNTAPGDGVCYAGRGYVQLTWKANYRKAGRELGLDLVSEPDLALDPKVASRILFAGMIEGWFTGKKLADFFQGSRQDWRGARRIINGLDQADRVAHYGELYAGALTHLPS